MALRNPYNVPPAPVLSDWGNPGKPRTSHSHVQSRAFAEEFPVDTPEILSVCPSLPCLAHRCCGRGLLLYSHGQLHLDLLLRGQHATVLMRKYFDKMFQRLRPAFQNLL